MKVLNNVTLVVARHCATQLNDEGRIRVLAWMSLYLQTEKNRRFLADNINTFMNGRRFDFAFCSPSKRAEETTRIAVPYLEPTIDSRVLVYDIGTADGLLEEETKNFKGFPLPFVYKDMENPLSYFLRVRSFFVELVTDPAFNNKNVFLSTHKDITALVKYFFSRKRLLSSLEDGQNNGNFKVYELLGKNRYAEERE